MITNSDQKLIADYLKGDEKSLEVLIGRYLKPIYSFVYHYVNNEAEAEDITQEVFIKAWGNLKRFKKEKNFKVWIFEIAKNTSIDFFRKSGSALDGKKTIPFSRFENEKGQNVLLEKIVDPKASLCDTFNNETLNLLNLAIEGLSPKYRIVFNYRHNDNLRFSEISQALGESINTVKSRYRRAIGVLRNSLGGNKL